MQNLLAKLLQILAQSPGEFFQGFVQLIFLSQPEWTLLILLWPTIQGSSEASYPWPLLRAIGTIIVRLTLLALTIFLEIILQGKPDAFESTQNLLQHP